MALRTEATVSTQYWLAWIYHLTSSRGETPAPCCVAEVVYIGHSSWVSSFWFFGTPARKLFLKKKKDCYPSFSSCLLEGWNNTFYFGMIISGTSVSSKFSSFMDWPIKITETKWEINLYNWQVLNQPWPKVQVVKLSCPPLFLLQILIQIRVFFKWLFKKSTSTWSKFSCYCVTHLKENKFCIRSLLCMGCRLHMQAWKFISSWGNQQVYLCYFSILTGKKFYTSSMTCWQLSPLMHIEIMFPQNDSVDYKKTLWDAIDNAVIPQKLWFVIFHSCYQF